MNFEFMTIDTPLPPCMPFPRALTGFPVSSTAKVMYCRMLDAILSKGQEDENGRAAMPRSTGTTWNMAQPDGARIRISHRLLIQTPGIT